MGLLEDRLPHLFGAGREPQRAPARPPRAPRSDIKAQPRRLPRRPVVRLDGQLVTLVPIGDLAVAMGRSVGHVRLLEQKGILPPPRARRRVRAPGHAGWRWYDLRFVEAVARIAAEEGVSSRRAVADLTRFSQRVWAVHRSLAATAGPTKG